MIHIDETILPCGLKGFDEIKNLSLCKGCYKDCNLCDNYQWFSCTNNCNKHCTIEEKEECYNYFKVGDNP